MTTISCFAIESISLLVDELSDLTGSGSEDTFEDTLERGIDNLEC